MKSMTGYGRGECDFDGVKFTVELNSALSPFSAFSLNDGCFVV
jgi:hypothetical protein